MTYVRRATAADLPELLPLCRAFHDESPHHSQLSFSDEKVASLIANVTQMPDWLALVACEDSGAIAGMALYFCQAAYYSDEREIYDLAFYVLPQHRARSSAAYKMAREVIRWSEQQQARRINQGILTEINHHDAVRFFERMGFVRKGVILVK